MLRLFKAIRPKEGYNVDDPPTHSKHTAELFARVRNNGRMLDEFKCVIEADFSLGMLFEDPVVSEFSAKIQRWLRDIDSERVSYQADGRTSSGWYPAATPVFWTRRAGG
jgi:hypothetical protein